MKFISTNRSSSSLSPRAQIKYPAISSGTAMSSCTTPVSQKQIPTTFSICQTTPSKKPSLLHSFKQPAHGVKSSIPFTNTTPDASLKSTALAQHELDSRINDAFNKISDLSDKTQIQAAMLLLEGKEERINLIDKILKRKQEKSHADEILQMSKAQPLMNRFIRKLQATKSHLEQSHDTNLNQPSSTQSAENPLDSIKTANNPTTTSNQQTNAFNLQQQQQQITNSSNINPGNTQLLSTLPQQSAYALLGDSLSNQAQLETKAKVLSIFLNNSKKQLQGNSQILIPGKLSSECVGSQFLNSARGGDSPKNSSGSPRSSVKINFKNISEKSNALIEEGKERERIRVNKLLSDAQRTTLASHFNSYKLTNRFDFSRKKSYQSNPSKKQAAAVATTTTTINSEQQQQQQLPTQMSDQEQQSSSQQQQQQQPEKSSRQKVSSQNSINVNTFETPTAVELMRREFEKTKNFQNFKNSMYAASVIESEITAFLKKSASAASSTTTTPKSSAEINGFSLPSPHAYFQVHPKTILNPRSRAIENRLISNINSLVTQQKSENNTQEFKNIRKSNNNLHATTISTRNQSDSLETTLKSNLLHGSKDTASKQNSFQHNNNNNKHPSTSDISLFSLLDPAIKVRSDENANGNSSNTSRLASVHLDSPQALSTRITPKISKKTKEEIRNLYLSRTEKSKSSSQQSQSSAGTSLHMPLPSTFSQQFSSRSQYSPKTELLPSRSSCIESSNQRSSLALDKHTQGSFTNRRSSVDNSKSYAVGANFESGTLSARTSSLHNLMQKAYVKQRDRTGFCKKPLFRYLKSSEYLGTVEADIAQENDFDQFGERSDKGNHGDHPQEDYMRTFETNQKLNAKAKAIKTANKWNLDRPLQCIGDVIPRKSIHSESSHATTAFASPAVTATVTPVACEEQSDDDSLISYTEVTLDKLYSQTIQKQQQVRSFENRMQVPNRRNDRLDQDPSKNLEELNILKNIILQTTQAKLSLSPRYTINPHRHNNPTTKTKA